MRCIYNFVFSTVAKIQESEGWDLRVLVGCFLRCFSGWTTDSSVRYGGLYPSRIFTVLGIYWFSLQAIPVVFWDRISMPSPSIHTCDRSFLSGLTGPLAGECHIFPWRLHPRKESPVKETVKKETKTNERPQFSWRASFFLALLVLWLAISTRFLYECTEKSAFKARTMVRDENSGNILKVDAYITWCGIRET